MLLALIYSVALLVTLNRVSFASTDALQEWIADVKARPGPPLEPLPLPRFVERSAVVLERDPFDALPASQRPQSPVSPRDVAEFRATRFVRSYIDIDQPIVLARDARGDLYRLRLGDRVNGGDIVGIEPERVILARGDRREEIEIREDR